MSGTESFFTEIGALCTSCGSLALGAHLRQLERPRPILAVPGLQIPVRSRAGTCRHPVGLGDERGAVGMGLGGQGRLLQEGPRRDLTHPTGTKLRSTAKVPDLEPHMTSL